MIDNNGVIRHSPRALSQAFRELTLAGIEVAIRPTSMSLLSSFVVLSSNKNSSAVTRSKGTSLLTEPSANRPLPVIEALARAQAARDRSTHAHARRVRRYAVALAG